MAPKYVKVMKEGKEAKIKYVENQEKLKCMVRGGPVAGGGGVCGGGALQVCSEGFSQWGIPGMNFRVSHVKRVYIVHHWTDI